MLLIVAVICSPLLWAVAALGTAAATPHLPLLVAAGVAASLTGSYLLSRVAGRVLRLRRRRSTAVVVATAATVATSLLAALTVLTPLPVRPLDQARPASGRWQLTTGSELAYDHLPAVGKARPHPVVLLHGGPGTPGSGPDAVGRPIAARGFDVYSYDQVGAGRSERLADPTGYTVARNVADLEAVRATLGAQRMVLVGTSWGATLAASYLAAHPDRVAGVVFSSPGALWSPAWADAGEGDIWDRVPPAQQRRADDVADGSRLTAWSLLMQVNPRAAHALVGDDEVDALFAEILRTVASAGTCDPASTLEYRGGRPGFYANQLVAADELTRPDPRPALRAVRTPALVLRGECDYKRPEIAAEYAATIPGAVLREIPDAGHLIRADQPRAYESALLTFLDRLAPR
jgi:proline iminopeptidase